MRKPLGSSSFKIGDLVTHGTLNIKGVVCAFEEGLLPGITEIFIGVRWLGHDILVYNKIFWYTEDRLVNYECYSSEICYEEGLTRA